MRGRKPKPTWLKLVAGNPGKRPLNVDEPQPSSDLKDPPDWFTNSQRAEWDAVIASAPPGLLKQIDASIVTVYAVAADLHREASQKVLKYGTTIKTPITGSPMQSPYVSIMNKQAQIMMRAAIELGFSPSSRSRIRVVREQIVRNKFTELKELGDE
jgi:P27 family predicted phage terminase small subunit